MRRQSCSPILFSYYFHFSKGRSLSPDFMYGLFHADITRQNLSAPRPPPLSPLYIAPHIMLSDKAQKQQPKISCFMPLFMSRWRLYFRIIARFHWCAMILFDIERGAAFDSTSLRFDISIMPAIYAGLTMMSLCMLISDDTPLPAATFSRHAG